MKKHILALLSALLILSLSLCALFIGPETPSVTATNADFIRWVDFNASAQIMQKVFELDKKTAAAPESGRLDFVRVLAYLATKNGNKFSYKRDLENLNKLTARVNAGETLDSLTAENKYFGYYYEAYSAIFSGFFGYYTIGSGGAGAVRPEYGLCAYFPLAAGYWHSGGDDFGNARSYGFKRVHLGHDIFGGVGTPVVAVEGGTISELGWNRYGGWRVGIRSLDGKRYYYYAHLRKDTPFAAGLKKGDTVEAGQVVGYLGATGYSTKPNANMKAKPHLHFGMQLIFDKSQEDGRGEIWIDVYQICKFLMQNKVKVEKTGTEYRSINLRRPVDFAPKAVQ